MKSINKIFLFLLLFCFSIPLSLASSKAPVDITKMDINDIKYALEKGYLTSELLVQLYLERIKEYNDDYNAILYLNDEALEEAKELDKLRSQGKIKGLLHGIPIVVKTNIDVKALATTAGAKSLKDNYPKNDSKVVAKLKQAGAIILGSTNMSEFAFSASDSNSSFGRVRNAYNPAITPYGSSGGSAVSVALSFAAAGLGTDTNSSVRLPAAANNLVGLRPSLGLISSKGVIPYDITRDTVGIITKTIEDNALILNAISEKVDNKTIDYTKIDTSLEGIRIGVPNEFLKGTNSTLKPLSKTDEDIYQKTVATLNKLKKLGATIIYFDDFYTSKQYNWWNDSLAGATFCEGFNSYIKDTTGTIRSFEALATSKNKIYELNGYLSSCDGKELNEIYAIRSNFQEYVNEVYKENDFDVIAYPTTKNKTFKLGTDTVKAPSSFVSSATGYPSLTVPMGFIDNLPYGIEFLGLKYNESTLYKIALNTYNSSFVSPVKAPSLYSISDETQELLDAYENEQFWDLKKVSGKFKKEIIKLKDSIKTFLKDYNNYEDETSEAKKLLNEYKILAKKQIANQNITLLIKILLKTIVYFWGLILLKKYLKEYRSRKKTKNML